MKEVICMHSEALESLVERLVQFVKEKHHIQEDEWISGEEAMRLLNVSSLTTMQRWRNEGKIRYAQIGKKIIIYYRPSIIEFISKHAKETF